MRNARINNKANRLSMCCYTIFIMPHSYCMKCKHFPSIHSWCLLRVQMNVSLNALYVVQISLLVAATSVISSGSRGRCWCAPPTPYWHPILLFSHTFLPKSGCIEGRRPFQTGRRPPQRAILDPQLMTARQGGSRYVYTWRVSLTPGNNQNTSLSESDFSPKYHYILHCQYLQSMLTKYGKLLIYKLQNILSQTNILEK